MPIHATIVTNETALLCDTREESHKQALNRFWRPTSASIRKSSLVSIEILVLDHGSLRVAGGRNDDSPSEDNSSTATASNNHGGIYNHDGGNNTQESDSNSDDEREH